MQKILKAALKALLEVFIERADKRAIQARIIAAAKQEVTHDFEQQSREAEGAAAVELADDSPRDITQRLRGQGL